MNVCPLVLLLSGLPSRELKLHLACALNVQLATALPPSNQISFNTVRIHVFPAGAGTRGKFITQFSIYLPFETGDEKYETHSHAIRFVADVAGDSRIRTKTHGRQQ
jgi:hypothetical protein